jgi:hypothetical protein
VGGYPELRIPVHTLDIMVKVFVTRYREFAEVLRALLSIIPDGCIRVTFRKWTWHKVILGGDKSLARPGWKQATVIEDFDFHVSYI